MIFGRIPLFRILLGGQSSVAGSCFLARRPWGGGAPRLHPSPLVEKSSGSCRCAVIRVPRCLRRLSLLGTFLNTFLTNRSPQAKHAYDGPRPVPWSTSRCLQKGGSPPVACCMSSDFDESIDLCMCVCIYIYIYI